MDCEAQVETLEVRALDLVAAKRGCTGPNQIHPSVFSHILTIFSVAELGSAFQVLSELALASFLFLVVIILAVLAFTISNLAATALIVASGVMQEL